MKWWAQRTAFGQALVELGKEFPNLAVIDPDVCLSTQTHLFREAFPDRFIQTGIAEQNAVGIAAGLSTLGYIPFVSAFAIFLTKRAGDQVRNSIAHPRANVKLNGGYGRPAHGRSGRDACGHRGHRRDALHAEYDHIRTGGRARSGAHDAHGGPSSTGRFTCAPCGAPCRRYSAKSIRCPSERRCS